ncbi:MAG TPA: MBL fold metallo-hydrolase [Burkholderiaceae bacterium]|nr:MBL fold metallo-hydrolase [Burkholderiaceae bacterium]
MKKPTKGTATWLAALAISITAWSAALSQTSAEAQPARITVLYDAFGRVANLQKDWGYSALIEVGGKRILFDTGDNPDILASNVKALGVDLSRLDFAVLSHRHGDHMGGMEYLLSVNPKVKIYAPKENFGIYGSSLPSKFYRKSETLAPSMRYYDGHPPDTMVFGSAWPHANIELIDQTKEIAPGLHLIALVSDKPGTLELKELSLAIRTADGIVLVVGCSHPGLDKIVAAAQAIDPHIHLIAGGFHMVVAPDAAIAEAATLLHDSVKVDYIAPGHCTGEPTFAALLQSFGDHYLYAGLGTVIAVGAQPRTLSNGAGASPELDLSDRFEYARRMAQSDDGPRPLSPLLAREP